jgi:hypothetical protein
LKIVKETLEVLKTNIDGFVVLTDEQVENIVKHPKQLKIISNL